jgi:hypothetical protein
VVTGFAESVPALAGAVVKCGSEGSETSGAAAGAVTGGDESALTLAGDSMGTADAAPGGAIGWPPGSAVKNSFAMRARTSGSGRPTAEKPIPGGEPAGGCGVSGIRMRRSMSLVLMIVSDFHVIERGNRIIRQH